MNRREVIAMLKEERDKAQAEVERCDLALAAFQGNGSPPRKDAIRRRAARGQRKREVDDYLRRNQDKAISAGDLARELGQPVSSTIAAIRAMAQTKQVTILHESPLTVEYRPTAVRPGETVTS